MHTDADPKKAVFIEKDVRHFPRYEHIQILWYGSTLTNNCCKTGLPERTLLKCRFVNAWLCMFHVWWEQFYWCCMYAKTASNKSKIFKKTACVLKPLRFLLTETSVLIVHCIGNFLLVRSENQWRRQLEVRLYSRSHISQRDQFGYSNSGKTINYML